MGGVVYFIYKVLCMLGFEVFMGGSCLMVDDDNVGVIGVDGVGDGVCYY